MNSKGQDKQTETRFWNQVASERIYAAFDENEYIDIFEKTMGRDLAGKTIVDIGCASGTSAALLASLGARVIGVDISAELIQQAKGLWVNYRQQIDFMVGDAEHLDLENESADVCFFGGVLHHFPKRNKVYEESLRILKPLGKFIALEPNRLDFFELIEWTVADLRGKLSLNEYPIDPNKMCMELEESGFQSIRFRTTRHDIPVLAQIPLLRNFFSRQKGFWLKQPILKLVNAFRTWDHRGTFFIIEALKL